MDLVGKKFKIKDAESNTETANYRKVVECDHVENFAGYSIKLSDEVWNDADEVIGQHPSQGVHLISYAAALTLKD